LAIYGAIARLVLFGLAIICFAKRNNFLDTFHLTAIADVIPKQLQLSAKPAKLYAQL
jgi:hypothetical protein